MTGYEAREALVGATIADVVLRAASSYEAVFDITLVLSSGEAVTITAHGNDAELGFERNRETRQEDTFGGVHA